MYYLILIIFWFIFFFPLFTGKPLFDDTIEQFYPMFYFLTENLKHFNLPFFNPYYFLTAPFANEIQFFPLNPFFIIRTIFGIFNNSLYAFNIYVSLNYLFSLLFFYLYLKNKLAFKEEIALFGSIVYTFSSCYILTIIHPNTYDLIPLIPLILYFLDTKPYLSSLFMGFALFSGHPQKPIYLFIIILTIYLIKILENKGFIKDLIIFLITLVPFAISLYLQGLDVYKISQRIESDIKFLLEMSFHFDKFITLLIPNFYGSIINGNYIAGPYYFYTEMTFYFSIVGLIFAIVGVISNFRDKFVFSLIISSIILIFIALGDQNPIIKFLYSEGIIKGIKAPVRALFLMPPIVAILACYGLNYILKNKNLRFLNTSLILILLVFLIFIPFIPSQIDISNEIFKFFLFIIITYIITYGLIRKVLSEKILLLLIILISYLDIYLTFNNYLRIEIYEDIENYYKPDFIEYLKPNKIGEYRVNARYYKGLVLPRNSGMINGIELTEGYDPLVSKYYTDIYNYIVRRYEGFENILRTLNVKYYITDNGFVELKNYLPRVYIVYCSKLVKDSSEFFSNVKNFEFNKCAYLQDETQRDYNSTRLYENVNVLKYTNNEILIEYNINEDAILVLSNNYNLYWKAQIDNKYTKILRANWTVMAIEIPKGKHIVKFHYDYSKFLIFIILWLIGIIIPLTILLLRNYLTTANFFLNLNFSLSLFNSKTAM